MCVCACTPCMRGPYLQGGAVSQADICPADPSLIAVSGAGFFRLFRMADGSLRSIIVNLKRDPQDYTCHCWIGDEHVLVGTSSGMELVCLGCFRCYCLHCCCCCCCSVAVAVAAVAATVTAAVAAAAAVAFAAALVLRWPRCVWCGNVMVLFFPRLPTMCAFPQARSCSLRAPSSVRCSSTAPMTERPSTPWSLPRRCAAPKLQQR